MTRGPMGKAIAGFIEFPKVGYCIKSAIVQEVIDYLYLHL